MNCGNYKSSKVRAIAIFLVILIAVFTGCAQNMAAKKDLEISPEPKLITEISTSEDSDSFNVLVKGNRMLTYMSVKQPFPLGVLLYFPETGLDNIKTNISPESEIIGSITASELTEEGHKSRIEILLKKDVPYKAANEGTCLKISFSKPPKDLSSPTLSSSGPVEKPVEKNEEKAVVESKKPAWVNRIDFSSEEAGKSTIIIGTTQPVEYRIKKASPQLLQLKLLNTRLPDYRKFPLITTRFESAVDRIIPVQTPAMKNTSMLTIELRESVPYLIEQRDLLLLVHFEASTISPRPLEDAKLPAWKKVLTQALTKEEVETEIDIDEEIPEGVVAEKYTGEKIALDFYETDIKNVFRILKEVSGKNFAIDKDVAGKVTLTLDKPVPWDQVLDLVLKMNQLGKVFEGDIIRIATAETLKKEEGQYKDLLKAKEEQKAVAPLTTEYISVNYANAQEDILPKIEAILTENRGSVSADKRTNIIIMTDVETKIEKAREIINSLDIPTRQVMIEARIVEATVDFARELGIKWGGNFYQTASHGRGRVDITERVFGAYDGGDYDSTAGATNYAVNLPGANLFTAAKGAGLGFTFGRIGGSTLDLDIRLMAMETNAEGKIISRPKIATLDNETARIKQGYDYPFKQSDESGNTTTTWKPVDLLLEVTPHITSDNRVSMAIKTTKNDLKPTGLSETPMMTTTKEAETKLLVGDGETIVIGGIIKETLNWSESKVPLLGDIPILGWLFKTKYRVTEKSE
ncbi:MAG: type IV pilus secretin PilQ, partial [Desulfobacteraceae bacterium]|nr:type IV pilus secretin PilQ [Desulfobacteraceae bacterium]